MLTSPKHKVDNSSNVIGFEYFAGPQILAVWFKSARTIYFYAHVPPEIYNGLLAILERGESVGGFIAREVRKKFNFSTHPDADVDRLRASEGGS